MAFRRVVTLCGQGRRVSRASFQSLVPRSGSSFLVPVPRSSFRFLFPRSGSSFRVLTYRFITLRIRTISFSNGCTAKMKQKLSVLWAYLVVLENYSDILADHIFTDKDPYLLKMGVLQKMK